MYSIYVEYDGGINTATEEAINAAAGYTFDGPVKCDSGCMIGGSQTRDLEFYYESGEQAASAAERLRSLSDVRVKTKFAA